MRNEVDSTKILQEKTLRKDILNSTENGIEVMLKNARR